MHVIIQKDEWYPVYDLEVSQDQDIDTVEIAESFYTRYVEAVSEFNRVQAILKILDDKRSQK